MKNELINLIDSFKIKNEEQQLTQTKFKEGNLETAIILKENNHHL